jgi:hypothetical protein
MTDHDDQPAKDPFSEKTNQSGSGSPRLPFSEETEAEDAVEREFGYIPAPGVPDNYSPPAPDDGEDKVDGEGAWGCPPDPFEDAAEKEVAPTDDDRMVGDDEHVDEIPAKGGDPENARPLEDLDGMEEGPHLPVPASEPIVASSKPGEALEPDFVQKAIPIGSVTLFKHIIVNPTRVAPADIEARAKEIESLGQRFYPKARPLPDGTFEVASSVIDVLAVQYLDKGAGSRLILVDVAEMSDENMFVFAHQEGRASASVIPYDRAVSLKSALATLRINQKQAAARFGLAEATVTNTLHVLELAGRLKTAVDPWSISENQAKRFQKLWNDKSRRKDLEKAIAGLSVGKARTQLAEIFARFPTSTKNVEPINDDNNNELGSIAKGSDGKLTIKLTAAAGNVPADELGAILAAEIGKQRQ